VSRGGSSPEREHRSPLLPPRLYADDAVRPQSRQLLFHRREWRDVSHRGLASLLVIGASALSLPAAIAAAGDETANYLLLVRPWAWAKMASKTANTTRR
jgi:hypothetical protein